MGRDELIKSTHYTINEADSIFGLSEVVCFSAARCDLRPIGHTDTYSVSAPLLGRHEVEASGRGVVEFNVKGVPRWKVSVFTGSCTYPHTRPQGNSEPRICDPTACTLKQAYFPAEHVVRWCEGCGRWYHAACLKRYTGSIGATTAPLALYAANDATLQARAPNFAKALMSPIQRAPPAFWTGNRNMTRSYPVSFEILITRARASWAKSGGAPPEDEHTWMMFNMGHALQEHRDDGRIVAEVQRRIKQFALLPIPALYQCRGCKWLV